MSLEVLRGRDVKTVTLALKSEERPKESDLEALLEPGNCDKMVEPGVWVEAVLTVKPALESLLEADVELKVKLADGMLVESIVDVAEES